VIFRHSGSVSEFSPIPKEITPHIDQNGFDLATSKVDLDRAFGLEFKSMKPQAAFGVPVHTFGYPLMRKELDRKGETHFIIEPRFLRGYTTRTFIYDQPGYRGTPVHELSFPAYEGLSGAPLIGWPGKQVIGLIIGQVDTSNVVDRYEEQEGSERVKTIVKRVVSFGLSQTVGILGSMITPDTNGVSLQEYLQRK